MRPAPKRMVPGDTSLALEATVRRDDLQAFHKPACIAGAVGTDWALGLAIDIMFIKGSLEVKLPTIWRDEKQSRRVEEKRRRDKEKELEERTYRCAKC